MLLVEICFFRKPHRHLWRADRTAAAANLFQFSFLCHRRRQICRGAGKSERNDAKHPLHKHLPVHEFEPGLIIRNGLTCKSMLYREWLIGILVQHGAIAAWQRPVLHYWNAKARLPRTGRSWRNRWKAVYFWSDCWSGWSPSTGSCRARWPARRRPCAACSASTIPSSGPVFPNKSAFSGFWWAGAVGKPCRPYFSLRSWRD